MGDSEYHLLQRLYQLHAPLILLICYFHQKQICIMTKKNSKCFLIMKFFSIFSTTIDNTQINRSRMTISISNAYSRIWIPDNSYQITYYNFQLRIERNKSMKRKNPKRRKRRRKRRRKTKRESKKLQKSFKRFPKIQD